MFLLFCRSVDDKGGLEDILSRLLAILRNISFREMAISFSTFLCRTNFALASFVNFLKRARVIIVSNSINVIVLCKTHLASKNGQSPLASPKSKTMTLLLLFLSTTTAYFLRKKNPSDRVPHYVSRQDESFKIQIEFYEFGRSIQNVLIHKIATFVFYYHVVGEYITLFALSTAKEKNEEHLAETAVASTVLSSLSCAESLEINSSARAHMPTTTDASEEVTTADGKADTVLPPPGFVQMNHLKQQKDVQLRKKKMDPPPGFYRMRERKRRKELAKRRERQASNSSKSRRLKPNRKRRPKATSGSPRVFEEIMNGAITDPIPEEFVVYLDSPSHDTRIQKFREMFQDEDISSTVRQILF